MLNLDFLLIDNSRIIESDEVKSIVNYNRNRSVNHDGFLINRNSYASIGKYL